MNDIQKESKNTDIEVYMNVNFVVRASSIATNKKSLQKKSKVVPA